MSRRSWHWPIILNGAICTRTSLFLVYNSSPISVNNGTCVDKASVISALPMYSSSLNNISVRGKESGLNDNAVFWIVSLLSVVGDTGLLQVLVYHGDFLAGHL